MNKRDAQKFEARLIEERKRCLKELGQLENEELMINQKEASGDLSSYSFHMADQGSDTMEREKNVFLVSSKGNDLYEIDQALLRIKDSKYGSCLHCGKEIERERLEAMPHARLCIKCRQEEEKESRNNRHGESLISDRV
ncbi:MAG TPA: transcriptional regulator [candidate division Zixibacteria bacterium]|jgi:RNA polymerase-binding transcription factor DksA|nr:transcriptional regulator [candidate division Zixibacteria bacterium]